MEEKWNNKNKKYHKWKEHLTLLCGLFVAIAFLYISGIGCPIKWLTGISCAGCGLTRAGFAVFHLHIKDAFHYHPLFWVVPIAAVVYVLQEKIPVKVRQIILWTCIILFLAVYVVRLVDPSDTVVTADWHNGVLGRILQHND